MFVIEVRYHATINHLPTHDDRERYLAINSERYPDAAERWDRYTELMIEKYGRGNDLDWQPIATFNNKHLALNYINRHNGDGRLRVVETFDRDKPNLPHHIYANNNPIGISFSHIVEANVFIQLRHESWLDARLSIVSTG